MFRSVALGLTLPFHVLALKLRTGICLYMNSSEGGQLCSPVSVESDRGESCRNSMGVPDHNRSILHMVPCTLAHTWFHTILDVISEIPSLNIPVFLTRLPLFKFSLKSVTLIKSSILDPWVWCWCCGAVSMEVPLITQRWAARLISFFKSTLNVGKWKE